jgi:UDP-N-acetylglucosamine 1-carboxyvinyltransferase
MNQLRITGGAPLSGEVAISGAKNATLPILAACLLASEKVTLSNVPHLRDVTAMCELLGEIGVYFEMNAEKHLLLQVGTPIHTIASHELTQKTRASILVLGPLLARFGKAIVALPGGCAIGDRPVDLHISGLEAMGASITIKDNLIYAECATRLQGASIKLHTVSVTATENLMMAATLAKGVTTIKNAAREPEIVDLALFLQKLGANIQGAGTDCIRIQGVEALHGGQYSVLTDRLEAATLLIAAACTRSEITINQIAPQLILSVLQKLEAAGADIQCNANSIYLNAQSRELKAVDVETAPYPGFPTDIQAQMLVFNTMAEGSSKITETIFENRFLHVPELQRMGADVQVQGRTALCKGVKHLIGTRVTASDLRASASLVLAGLMAKGDTIVDKIDYMDRGYEYFEEKLLALGANIHLIQ